MVAVIKFQWGLGGDQTLASSIPLQPLEGESGWLDKKASQQCWLHLVVVLGTVGRYPGGDKGWVIIPELPGLPRQAKATVFIRETGWVHSDIWGLLLLIQV
jgi:hypothetical protein